jgi:hypothetical protein
MGTRIAASVKGLHNNGQQQLPVPASSLRALEPGPHPTAPASPPPTTHLGLRRQHEGPKQRSPSHLHAQKEGNNVQDVAPRRAQVQEPVQREGVQAGHDERTQELAPYKCQQEGQRGVQSSVDVVLCDAPSLKHSRNQRDLVGAR